MDVSVVRITLQDVSNSEIPGALGICRTDYPRLADKINLAQQRLINAGGETGFWGGWAKVVFNVLCNDPFITLPNEFARAIGIDVCRMPVRIQNEWYETLEAGIGLRTPCDGRNGIGAAEVFDRGMYPTAFDLTPTNKLLRVYITDPRDINRRILFSGAKDENGHAIYSQDTNYQVDGFFLTFTQPFATSDFIVTAFAGIQKDQTYGDVILKQVDATTGVETFLSRFGPQVMAPQFRRYYINRMPKPRCCIDPAGTTTQVTSMCKYEYRPALLPTDFLIIGNIPALDKECAAIRHEGMDSDAAKRMAVLEHQQAIRFLNQELTHYLGTQQPAINVAPFGTARLQNQAIGSLI